MSTEAAALQAMIPPRGAFRFAVPCRYRKTLWSAKGLNLGPEYGLVYPGELDGAPQFADVRAAWNEEGLAFSVRTSGKKRPAWCRSSRMVESDGLNVWIDTRPTQMIHRASRFCHHFAFLPTGAGKTGNDPAAGQLLINRAKEQASPSSGRQLHVRSEPRVDGYVLECFLEAAALTGFAPDEQPQIGFTYLVLDAELGQQTFTVGAPFPYREDPSLWALLDLVK